MAVSKLESLPNEILTELFEKYVNGVDVLIAFGHLNNQRFDTLIAQCNRFFFDFRGCSKEQFRFCLDNLPNQCIGKIEELVLSEQNTPGQIQLFLSAFPSFISFQRLRQLHLYIYAYSANWPLITATVRSLAETAVEAVSIEIIGTNIEAAALLTINDILGLRTLKRLSFSSNQRSNIWSPITVRSPTLEYLKYSDTSYELHYLPTIFRCAPHLKYLDIQISSDFQLNWHQALGQESDQIVSMPALRTLILTFTPDSLATLDALAIYLRMMPALQRLEIKAHRPLLDANVWQNLLETSLPSLRHFRLKSTKSSIASANLDIILASFETPFWVAKPNFYLIITEHRKLHSNGFYPQKGLLDERDEYSHPVVQWWIVPTRARVDHIATRDILSFGLTKGFQFQSDYYYFENVKQLIVYNLDLNLLDCLAASVSYSRIKHLDVSAFDHLPSTIAPLVSRLESIISLRIQYRHLFLDEETFANQWATLKYLDISVHEHRFTVEDLSAISELFPRLNHLAVNSRQLSSVQLLKMHLPHLYSLTYAITDGRYFVNRDDQHYLDVQSSLQVPFSFHRNSEWLTVWIDQAALKEPYWTRLKFGITNFFSHLMRMND